MSDWKPIDTAPRDGRPVHVFVDSFGLGPMTLAFIEGRWRDAEGYALKAEPSYWTPPPKESA